MITIPITITILYFSYGLIMAVFYGGAWRGG